MSSFIKFVWFKPGGMTVLYLCAQLAVLYTYNLLTNIDKI